MHLWSVVSSVYFEPLTVTWGENAFLLNCCDCSYICYMSWNKSTKKYLFRIVAALLILVLVFNRGQRNTFSGIYVLQECCSRCMEDIFAFLKETDVFEWMQKLKLHVLFTLCCVWNTSFFGLWFDLCLPLLLFCELDLDLIVTVWPVNRKVLKEQTWKLA